jgi:hypothetical protein
MMVDRVGIFVELGRRMSSGLTTGLSDGGHGAETSSGFGPTDVATAARNIVADMLNREALSEWLALYPALPVARPRNVLVIMAGNIPFVGMQDLVCVLAAGHRAVVKPSSKDLDNMSWVVRQLLDIAPDLPLSLLSGSSPTPDAVIAMGNDDTVAAIGEKYSGIPMLLRGNRSSLAVLSGDETDDELASLADDVLSFSGLGCRNVSLVFVPRGYDFSRLQSVMAQRAGSVGPGFAGNYRQARAMLRMSATPHIDTGAALMVEVADAPDFPAQPSVLHFAIYDDPTEAADWIARHDHEIQCVARNLHSSLFTLHFNRAVPLGQTQRPRLTDYPDGRDTMQFLETI